MIISADEPLSGLFPKPQQITLTGGASDLSSDVRLVTSNVLPLQRKAMRGILTSAGIRVVANKKKFIIETRVMSPDDLDLSSVPEDKLAEYYELQVDNNRIYIRAASQCGALRATHTLANVYRLLNAELPIPNMLIQDWPEIPCRGVLMPNTWGLDQMDLLDWNLMLDYLASLKLNCAVVEMFGPGRVGDRIDAQEFLLLPLSEMEEVKTEVALNWRSAKHDQVFTEPKSPGMFTDDFVADVLGYGQEKGVEFVPSFNLGENVLVAQATSGATAKTATGANAKRGFCIAAAATRDFVAEKLCHNLVEKYPGEDPLPFMVFWVDSRQGSKLGMPCECEQCSSPEKVIQSLIMLIKTVQETGIAQVVLGADNVAFANAVFTDKFVTALAEAGLEKDVLVLLHGAALADNSISAQIKQWLSPVLRDAKLSDVEKDCRRLGRFVNTACERDEVHGVVVEIPLDPIWLELDAVLADFSWHKRELDAKSKHQERWMMARFGVLAEAFYAAYGTYHEILRKHDVLRACFYGPESNTSMPLAADFPQALLEQLDQLGDDACRQLCAAHEAAASAVKGFEPLADAEELNDNERLQVRNLLGEAAKIKALTDAFIFLLHSRKAIADSLVPPDLLEKAKCLPALLHEQMTVIEARKADWTVPAVLHMLNILLQAVETAKADLQCVT